MSKRYMRFCAIAVITVLTTGANVTFAKNDKNNGVPGDIAGVGALVQQLFDKLFPPTNGTTRILFPFVTNQSGFDTGFAVSNTGVDSTGTVGTAGTITFHFFGASAPASFTTGTIQPGTTYANIASSVAPGFQGYIEADCNFPLAHGFGFLSDLGARNLAATIPALILPPVRSTSLVESAGQ